jgi:glycerol-3-phosphate dehydrogenase
VAPTPVCTLESRNLALAALRGGSFDFLVLGGGINGAGVFRDLALRNRMLAANQRIGLVEKNQFGSGTSGRNSHLIHGGLRYLKYFDFGLVREALHERAVLLRIAPHLVEPLGFIIPFRNIRERLFYSTGLVMYDRLAGRRGIGTHRHISPAELESLEPELRLDSFRSAALFMDCRMQAARLVLENIWDGIGNGASAANYVEVLEYRRQDRIWTVRLRDRLSGEEFTTTARILVHATGAWTEDPSVRLVRGSHLILPKLNRSAHAVAYFEPAGRIVFFIPWGSQEEFTLVGTTEVDHPGRPDEVAVSAEEVGYLLRIAREVFRDEAVGDPLSSFSSLRPLVLDPAKSATATSREHRIWMEDDVVRIAGGKYTTYRSMSEEAADLAWPDTGDVHATESTPINGNSPDEIARLLEDSSKLTFQSGLQERELRSLIKSYGVYVRTLLAYYQEYGEAAPIAYAARHEMAQHLTDLLFVSTTWGYEHRWNFETLHPYAAALGSHLGWDEDRVRAEVQQVLPMASVPLLSGSEEPQAHPIRS